MAWPLHDGRAMLRGISIGVGAVLVVLVGTAPTRADKWNRGATIFDDRCARCHSLEAAPPAKAGQPRVVDLSNRLDKKSADELRAWLRSASAVSKTTQCTTDLDGADVDAMLALLSKRRHFASDNKVRPPAFEARREPPKWPARMEKRR
jgi:cytochrome c553